MQTLLERERLRALSGMYCQPSCSQNRFAGVELDIGISSPLRGNHLPAHPLQFSPELFRRFLAEVHTGLQQWRLARKRSP